ncbi:hypothetical protein MMC11_005291 [Xylographa trunciseda]|nr:hypothetical protein [Xylographa trunciseda]
MRPSTRTGLCALAVFIILFDFTSAHSWVEQLMLVNPNGTFVGTPGFIRGYVSRSTPGFNDGQDDYLVPPNGRQNQSLILPTDPLCKSSQSSQNSQTTGNPRLQAPVGSSIALQYQENGHVSLPNNQPGKPPRGGLVYIYGTSSAQANPSLLDVHRSWTTDGTGGDKQGKLLATQYFDDGRCYQVNGGNISVARQAEFKFAPSNPMGANLWCQNDILLPSDAEAGKPYTLYWVWDWPTAAGVDPSLPDGKEEIYTSCMDIDVIAAHSSTTQKDASSYISGQPINNAAIPSYLSVLDAGSNFLASTPARGSASLATDVAPAAVSSTTASASTTAVVQGSPATSVASPFLTVYPITTLLTTVLVSANTAASTPQSTVTGTATLSTDTTISMPRSTVTVTPTVYVTAPVSAASASATSVASDAASAASSPASMASLSAPSTASSTFAPLAPPLAAAAGSTASASSAPLNSRSNCTSGTIQRRSKVLPRSPHFRKA